MATVTFSAQARALVDECLARPYPATSQGGEAVVERDAWGAERVVFTDVPTGLGADAIVDRVARDVRSGQVMHLRSIHNESSDVVGTRIVFTPAPDANLAGLTEAVRASFERARPGVESQHSRIRSNLATQDLIVTLDSDDWSVIHDVLLDACARRPTDRALVQATSQVEVCLYGEDSG